MGGHDGGKLRLLTLKHAMALLLLGQSAESVSVKVLFNMSTQGVPAGAG